MFLGLDHSALESCMATKISLLVSIDVSIDGYLFSRALYVVFFEVQ